MNTPVRLITISCLALLLNMTGFLAVAAVLPELFLAFSLSESDAGWLTGSSFAAYAAGVPIFTAITDRVDARRVVLVALLIGTIAGVGFALFATGFWSAVMFRLLAGFGFAGMHFPGLKMLTDRLPETHNVRSAGVYVSMFSLGGAGSYLLSGLVMSFLTWHWVFAISGACSLLGAILIWFAMPARPTAKEGRFRLPDFRPMLGNPIAMRYAFAYFGHVWEMFAYRNWFVVMLGLSIALPQNAAYSGWNLPFLAAMCSLAAWPASLVVAELAARFSRNRVITGVALVSLGVAVLIASSAQAPAPLLFAMLLLYSMTCFGDSTALTGGLISVVQPGVRGTSLALYALFGFCGGALGPTMVGIVLELLGGRAHPHAWVGAWLTMAVGAVIVATVLNVRTKSSNSLGA